MSNRERRTAKRVSTNLTAVVKGRESTADFWKETTDIVTVSKLGASFDLKREIPIGRIISIIAKMPTHLRCYDEDKKLYRVWGLVQHCSPMDTEGFFHIGVAFIGKHAPSSYIESPMKTYRVVGMDSDGFWHVGETKEPFVKREHHRFPNALPCKIYTETHSDTQVTADLDAVTENISAGGASIFSMLEVREGDAIRFVSVDPPYESSAVVRNRQSREGDRSTVHIEFTEANFPVRSLLGSEPEVDEKQVQTEVEDALTSKLEDENGSETKTFGILDDSSDGIANPTQVSDSVSESVLPDIDARLDEVNLEALPEPEEFSSDPSKANTDSEAIDEDEELMIAGFEEE